MPNIRHRFGGHLRAARARTPSTPVTHRQFARSTPWEGYVVIGGDIGRQVFDRVRGFGSGCEAAPSDGHSGTAGWLHILEENE